MVYSVRFFFEREREPHYEPQIALKLVVVRLQLSSAGILGERHNIHFL